jgi:ferritin-like metal-binding protein YciE
MSFGFTRSIHSSRLGNLTERERWISTVLGAGLTLGSLAGGGFLRRLALSAGGLTLITRGLGGYCGMKAAVSGQATLREGMREQWERVRAQAGAGAGGIDSLDTLYIEELQELTSSSAQVELLATDLERAVEHEELKRKLRSYATLLRSRREDLERVLRTRGARAYRHRDQAMHALVEEVRKMARIADGAVRDAALVDSIQRLLHYQIAAYGSVAAHGKALGEDEAALRLAEYADRDKSLDTELSELAKELLNPRAATASRARSRGEARAH